MVQDSYQDFEKNAWESLKTTVSAAAVVIKEKMGKWLGILHQDDKNLKYLSWLITIRKQDNIDTIESCKETMEHIKNIQHFNPDKVLTEEEEKKLSDDYRFNRATYHINPLGLR